MKFLKFDYETFFIDIPHSTAPIGLRQRPFSAFGGAHWSKTAPFPAFGGAHLVYDGAFSAFGGAHWSKTAPFPAFGGAQLVYDGAPFPHSVAPIWSLTTPAFGGALLSTTTPAFDGALWPSTEPFGPQRCSYRRVNCCQFTAATPPQHSRSITAAPQSGWRNSAQPAPNHGRRVQSWNLMRKQIGSTSQQGEKRSKRKRKNLNTKKATGKN